jgi:VIT1/CCC1 family predicted Fe2+/Mn2+ transporter
MKSKMFWLNAKDFIKGLVIAVLTAILTFLQGALLNSEPIDLTLIKKVGVAAAIGFISYLIKNLFTNKDDEILKPDKK